MPTTKTFLDQPVRLFLRNKAGTELEEMRFRTDIAARLDPGIPSARIPDAWKGAIRVGSRTVVVTFHDKAGLWFYADILDLDEDEDDESDDEAWDRAMREHNAEG